MDKKHVVLVSPVRQFVQQGKAELPKPETLSVRLYCFKMENKAIVFDPSLMNYEDWRV